MYPWGKKPKSQTIHKSPTPPYRAEEKMHAMSGRGLGATGETVDAGGIRFLLPDGAWSENQWRMMHEILKGTRPMRPTYIERPRQLLEEESRTQMAIEKKTKL